MNLLFEALRSIVLGTREVWNEDADETVQYLRSHKQTAEAEAARLRGIGISLTGNILEDNVTGAASRYRRYRRNEPAS